MFGTKQAIANPFGITVFGSHTSRVEPDFASLRVAVSVVEQEAAHAFSISKERAHTVQEFLSKQNVAEYGASRVALTRLNKFVHGTVEFVGYQARISFSIMLKELDRVDTLAGGLVSAGANEIESIVFETSQLKEVRAEARRKAMTAACDKAQNYCAAGRVSLGRILHIEDLMPLSAAEMPRSGSHYAAAESAGDYDGDIRAFDPSLIEIKAAVLVAYELKEA